MYEEVQKNLGTILQKPASFKYKVGEVVCSPCLQRNKPGKRRIFAKTMEVAEKLAQIRSEIAHAIPVMVNVSDQVRTLDVSKYPIFVVHPDAIEIGVPIMEKTEHNRWAVHVSTLEEFVTKQIIHPEKINEFRQVFKDPDIYLCLFVLSDLGAQFVFMPVVP